MLNEKDKRKIAKLAKLMKEGELAITEHLFEVEEKLDEVLPKVEEKIEVAMDKMMAQMPDMDSFAEKIRGKDGYNPEKGKDYFDGEDGKDYVLTEKDKKDIAKKIEVPVVEKVIEKNTKEVIREVVDTSAIALEASKLAYDGVLPLIPTMTAIGQEMPMFGASFRDGLELLQGDERLSMSAVKDLEETIATLQNRTQLLNQIATQGQRTTSSSSGASNFLSLTDTPSSYAGEGTKAVRVNAGETGLEFFTLAGGGDALKADPLSQFAATTSLQLKGVISDETGSGALVFADTPTLVTPVLGAATGTSLNLSGLTASEIVITDASKNLASAAVATYPSLAELAYVKGVTSAIQTQLNGKAPSLGADDNYVTDAQLVVIGNTSGTNTGNQTITNSSDATSHTVTLSASGGSVQLIEGSNITLTTGGTGSAGTVTIAATGGGGATTALDNLASVAINTSLISDTNNTDSLGSTGVRWAKLWATDVESTNMPTVGGTSLSSTFQGLDTQLTSLAALTYAGNGGRFIRLNAGETDFELAALAGGGNVSNTGTPLNNQIAIFTDATTIEGDTAFTFDTTTDTLAIAASGKLAFGAVNILDDAAGTTTLSNIDALDATTEATVEAAIDTLANLTSIQGRTVTLADAGANAIFGWDDTAGAYENLSQAEVLAVIGDSTATAKGVVELATDAEAVTGTDTARAVTPANLTARLAAPGAIGGTTAAAITGTTITTNTGLMPDINDGAYLGQAGTAFSDLFLAEGAVINWDSGDATLTQTGNVVALAGADLQIATAGVGTNADSVPTLSSTNTLTNKTLTSPAINTATLGGHQVMAENAGLLYDPTLSADGTYNGDVWGGTAGATLAFGDLVYLDPTDSRWELVDANAAAAADGDARGLLGICVLAAAADGNATVVLLKGMVRADAAFPALTINNPVYCSETAGDITQTEPTTTDAVIRKIGVAITADAIYFSPDWIYDTHV